MDETHLAEAQRLLAGILDLVRDGSLDAGSGLVTRIEGALLAVERLQEASAAGGRGNAACDKG